jgi:hypothetical protein
MAKKSRRVTRRGGVQSLTEPQMQGVQSDLSDPSTHVLLEPNTPVPESIISKGSRLHKSAETKPEDKKVGMLPTPVRKAGRKTRRRVRRGGGLGENSATWPPDNSAFGAKIGSPENTDNLLGYGGKGGKRRRFTRKQCKKFKCKNMGFTQKASCRPYKNCYRKK